MANTGNNGEEWRLKACFIEFGFLLRFFCSLRKTVSGCEIDNVILQVDGKYYNATQLQLSWPHPIALYQRLRGSVRRERKQLDQ